MLRTRSRPLRLGNVPILVYGILVTVCMSIFYAFFVLNRENVWLSRYQSKILSFATTVQLGHLPDDYPDDLESLSHLCAQVDWVPNRIWQCDAISGGTSNVYNALLTCVRIAIEAGATTFIPPSVWRRDAVEKVRVVTGDAKDLTDLSYLFDYDHLTATIFTACPRIQIYRRIRDVPELSDDPRYLSVNARDFGLSPKGWRDNLDSHLESQKASGGGSFTYPTYEYILAARLMFAWPVFEDGERFAKNFKSVLHFRNDVRGLAGSILERMEKTFGHLNNTSTYISPVISRVSYFGAHLRTGSDIDPDWANTGFEQQFESYVSTASKNNISLIYLGSGVPQDRALFVQRARAEYDIEVTTKDILLADSPRLLALLNSMSSDQQAAVDFEVLSRASMFGGMHRSSFAWQIAWRKHIYSNISRGESLRDRPRVFEDEFSHILNTEPDKWFDFFMWGTWP